MLKGNIALRAARVAQALTQRECSVLIGCHPNTYAMVEEGRKRLSKATEEKLAALLRTPRHELFNSNTGGGATNGKA